MSDLREIAMIFKTGVRGEDLLGLKTGVIVKWGRQRAIAQD